MCPRPRRGRCDGLSHHAHAEGLARWRAVRGPLPVEPPVRLDWQTACAQRGEALPEQCPTCGQRLVCTGVMPRGGAPPVRWAGGACSIRMTRPGDAGQRGGASAVDRVGSRRSLRNPLRALSTPGPRTPPGHAGLPGPVAGMMEAGEAGITSIACVGAHRVRPYRYAVSPTRSCSGYLAAGRGGPGRDSVAAKRRLTPNALGPCQRQDLTHLQV
jgi:hypothetical protein